MCSASRRTSTVHLLKISLQMNPARWAILGVELGYPANRQIGAQHGTSAEAAEQLQGACTEMVNKLNAVSLSTRPIELIPPKRLQQILARQRQRMGGKEGIVAGSGAPEDGGGLNQDEMYDTPSGISSLSRPETPENHDIATLDPLLRRIYPLHPLHRQILQVVLQLEFEQLRGSPGYQQNLESKFTNAQHLISLLAPISRMPAEIEAEMLLLAIQSIGHSPIHLMQVCGSWHTVIKGISRLWLSLKLGVWTAHEPVLAILQRSGELPLEVEIDTTDDIKNINGSRQRYKALADTIPSMPRWKTLKILTSSAIKSSESINDEAWMVSQLSKPLSRLESFTILGQCPSSPFVDKLVSTISDTSLGTLRSIQVPCPSVISRIVGHRDYGIFHSLVTLKVQRKAVPQEGEIIQMDFLPHMKCLEVLELTSIPIPNYPLNTTLPLVQTDRKSVV